MAKLGFSVRRAYISLIPLRHDQETRTKKRACLIAASKSDAGNTCELLAQGH